MLKRLFDIFLATLGLIILFPLFILLAILIKIDSKGTVFYKQTRVGRFNSEFKIFKFRTMFTHSDTKGLLTIGNKDSRITKIGYFLRKHKLDELPQLINVLNGSMRFVGPRPEVRKFVNHYSKADLEILQIKPGITDYASIAFRNEVELLKNSNNPEKLYIEEIIPKKIALNKKYIASASLFEDIKIILKTLQTIIK